MLVCRLSVVKEFPMQLNKRQTYNMLFPHNVVSQLADAKG